MALGIRPPGTSDVFWNYMQAQAAQAQAAQLQNAMSAYNQAASQSAVSQLLGMQNAYQNVQPIRPPHPGKERTPDEIKAQLEARLAEMEAEANSPRWVAPCEQCKWRYASFCINPFVIGLERKNTLHWDYSKEHHRNTLCGPEKALWEPRPTLWQRFIAWLLTFTTPA